MVRAKFRVLEIKRQMGTAKTGEKDGRDVYGPVEMQTIVMSPVYSNDPNSENKKFWDASPSGKIELGIINKAAWENFELDKEYYVDFTKAGE